MIVEESKKIGLFKNNILSPVFNKSIIFSGYKTPNLSISNIINRNKSILRKYSKIIPSILNKKLYINSSTKLKKKFINKTCKNKISHLIYKHNINRIKDNNFNNLSLENNRNIKFTYNDNKVDELINTFLKNRKIDKENIKFRNIPKIKTNNIFPKLSESQCQTNDFKYIFIKKKSLSTIINKIDKSTSDIFCDFE